MRPVDRIRRSRPRIRRIDLVSSRIRRALQEACMGYVGGITHEAVGTIIDYVRNLMAGLPSMLHRTVSVEPVDMDKDNCSIKVSVDIV